jgi:hypothetical protein
MSFDLDNYNTVADRIREFFERYPEGSLRQVKYELQLVPYYVKNEETKTIELVGDKAYLVYTAAAYRTADDPNPGEGTAWEPVPGRTPYTRDSEMQNAETSAWGRAIIAAGAADTRKGIASREDVESRRGDG